LVIDKIKKVIKESDKLKKIKGIGFKVTYTIFIDYNRKEQEYLKRISYKRVKTLKMSKRIS
jgi:glycine betaine/choline ABC-type transport system substrate-binding protein